MIVYEERWLLRSKRWIHGSDFVRIMRLQVPYILERYKQFLEGISVTEMDDWACVCGTKKRNPAHNWDVGNILFSVF